MSPFEDRKVQSMDSVTTNESGSSQDVILEFDYEIEEDVEGELEEFVRLSHTGQFKEAHELFDECLQRHIDWYPVAAEYADCLLREGQFEQLAAFSQKAAMTFQETSENALLDLMLMIGSLLPRDVIWQRLQDLWPDLSLSPPFTSLKDTDIHLLEVTLQILVFSGLRPEEIIFYEYFDESVIPELTSTGAWSVFIDWFYYLLHHGYFWEAQRILCSLFHQLPWLQCWDMVQDHIAKALSTETSQEPVQIAVSSMIQHLLYVFKSANPNPLAVVQWNDAFTWALFGVTLVKAEEGFPSLFSRICLRRSLQEELGLKESLPMGSISENDEMSNPLVEAFTNGDYAMVQAVIAGPSHYTLDEINDWVFTSAAPIYSRKMLPFPNSQDVGLRDGYLRTPLHWASLIGKGDAVETLLNTGEADAHLLDWFGCTPLHYAVSSCVPESETEDIAIVKALLDSDHASVNTRDPSGLTPLYMAIVNRSYSVAEKLLERNAIVETSDYGALLMLAENDIDWLSKWKLLLSRYDPLLQDESISDPLAFFRSYLEARKYEKGTVKYPGMVGLETDAALILRKIPPQAIRLKSIQTLFVFLLENDLSGTAFPTFQVDEDGYFNASGSQTPTVADTAAQRNMVHAEWAL